MALRRLQLVVLVSLTTVPTPMPYYVSVTFPGVLLMPMMVLALT